MTLRPIQAWLLAGLIAAAAPGCNRDDDDAAEEAGEGETTSGGETDGPDNGLEAPPGSVGPEEGEDGETASGDGASDGSGSEGGSDATDADATEGGSGETADGSGAVTTGDETPSEPEEEEIDPVAMWGASRSEQCRVTPRPTVAPAAVSAIAAGVAAGARGDTASTDAARSHFERALSADRNAFAAAYNLGVLADRAADEVRALEYFRQALRSVPDYVPALRGITTIHLRRGNASDALAAVEPVARANQANGPLQALLAEMYVANRRYDTAWTAIRTALRCDETSIPALRAAVRAARGQGRTELARSILSRALELEAGRNDPELHYLQARIHLESGAPLRRALDELRRAVELRSDYADARMELGLLYLRGGNYPQAIESFEIVVALMPRRIEAHLNLADALRSARRWTEAKAAFDRVLAMNPNLPEAHYNLGLMYQTQGVVMEGMDELQLLQAAKQSLLRYRDLVGSRVPPEAHLDDYLTSVDRRINDIEEARRWEEEERRAAEAEAAAAAAAAEGGGDAGGDGTGDGTGTGDEEFDFGDEDEFDWGE